jgi:hypothetical protein
MTPISLRIIDVLSGVQASVRLASSSINDQIS